ncbi:MAG: hypothetical protein QOG13_434 [Sphingomonadales bacterium]|jgi:hypothetical protein|nr:hypothetical protein [Sphingomonadales bacterium]MEA3043190.1 hypothetical protein [Sphingomonadales bacterium]
MAERVLTGGETALAKAAHGDKIAYPGVRIVDGPGTSFAAHIAFMRGNPAITLGSTIYYKLWYTADFAGPNTNAGSFLHEMTHVWQYAVLGQGPFFARYTKELAKAGNPDKLYEYKAGVDLFTKATLEAQAQMVEDYSRALWGKNAAGIALLAKNLAGSGVYGL